MERTRESNESRYIQNNFQTDSIPVLFEKENTTNEEVPYPPDNDQALPKKDQAAQRPYHFISDLQGSTHPAAQERPSSAAPLSLY